MYRLTVVYDEPADKEAFDRRYTDEHVPLVKASPGLVRQPHLVMFEALSLVVASAGSGLVEAAPV